MSEPMRIHRALAHAGVASRRAAEALVKEGRVTVNGAVADVGQLVTAADAVAVDGRLVEAEPLRMYMVNKPAGVVCTVSDPEGRRTILEGLPEDVRLYPVGRLDADTTGAILVTNDGDLAHRLMHPSSEVTKVYEALVEGRVSAATVRRLRSGVELEDGMTAPCACEVIPRDHPGATWLRLELHEGRNRQVRRMCDAVGHRVLRLHRPRYAGIGLRGMSRGDWRLLKPEEIGRLRKLVGLAP